MSDLDAPVPLLGFAAWSGTGKTTLLCAVLPHLRLAGLRVGLVKHAHHHFDIDHPGKDSYELRQAGAGQVLVASRHRWALIRETPGCGDDPALDALIGQLDLGRLDLVLVEGFRHLRFPKIELHRPALGKPLLYPDDDSIIAIAHDGSIDPPPAIPSLSINEPEAVAELVIRYVREWNR
ncbi:MAG: molybdopterin-guanine dinucleotide biosynthesis protein B [Gammaproteobacteria bacterium]|nr:molybdopterin-guanine dinucleotide biosynthesis protein B [Gammaproteobacteria bacterium]